MSDELNSETSDIACLHGHCDCSVTPVALARWSGRWWLDLASLVLSVVAGVVVLVLAMIGLGTLIALRLHLIHLNLL